MKKIFDAIWKVLVFFGVIGGCITTALAVWYGWWVEKAFGWKNLKELMTESAKFYNKNKEFIMSTFQDEEEEA